MRETVQRGMPAVIRGPFGRFTHAKGGKSQLWIAGGLGIAPFLGWLRALEEDPAPGQIDFFYSAADGGAAFVDELDAIALTHEELRIHLVNTSTDSRLTAAQALATAGGDPSAFSVFLCGPEGMVHSFQTELRHAGVPAKAIHREYFNWR